MKNTLSDFLRTYWLAGLCVLAFLALLAVLLSGQHGDHANLRQAARAEAAARPRADSLGRAAHAAYQASQVDSMAAAHLTIHAHTAAAQADLLHHQTHPHASLRSAPAALVTPAQLDSAWRSAESILSGYEILHPVPASGPAHR